jgi:hypothetical protein
MFKSEEIVDPFWEILMAHEQETTCDNRVKLKFFESMLRLFRCKMFSENFPVCGGGENNGQRKSFSV